METPRNDPAPDTAGKRLELADTPCLLLDESRMEANISRLRKRLEGKDLIFRPHLKTAKSVEAARRMLTAGDGPATVSTLREAERFAAAGITDLTYAVGIAPCKLPRVRALLDKGVRLSVILDSVEQAEAVAAHSRPGMPVSALIELDCDGHRSGVAPDDSELLLAIAKGLTPGAELCGVLVHAGESYRARNEQELAAAAENERLSALRAAAILRSGGFACPVVSVGSTPTALSAPSYEGLTEVRAGVFVFFDLVQAGLGLCSPDDIALSVLATVIGRHREKGRIIVDAGWTALSCDRGTAGQKTDQGYGLVCDVRGRPLPGLIVTDVNQEHGIVARRDGKPGAMPDLPIGARLRILPSHACATADKHDRYHVIGAGGSLITAEWPRFGGW